MAGIGSLVVLMLAAPAPPEAANSRLAVVPIARQDTGEPADDLTEVVEAEAKGQTSYAFTPHAFSEAQLGPEGSICPGVIILAIGSWDCLGQLARAASARYLLVGVVSTDPIDTHLTLQLYDDQQRTFVAEQQVGSSGTARGELAEIARMLTRRLLAPQIPTGAAVVHFEGPPQSVVAIDDGPEKPLPLELTLVAGSHRVRLQPPFAVASLGTFDALAGAKLTYVLTPLPPTSGSTHHASSHFPWEPLVGLALAGGAAALLVVGSQRINVNAQDQTGTEYQAALIGVGFATTVTLGSWALTDFVTKLTR